MKFKTWELALALGLVLTLFTGAVWAADTDAGQQALADKLLRLHVVAHSDSDADQRLKRDVRDAVYAAASGIVQNAADSTQAEAVIAAQTDALAAAAAAVIAAHGYDYDVTVSTGESYFPTKEYDGFRLPAGTYRALRVVIGEGKGQNWWCVVFPPLRVSAATETIGGDALRAGLSESEVKLITESDMQYVYRFKCMEWWAKIKQWFK